MEGKRERLARVLDRAGVWKTLLWARNHGPSPFLTVLTYHRVSEPAAETRFDTAVIDATPAQFESQVAFLKQHFHIIGIEDLLDFQEGGRLPRNPVLITFDDGYRDCYDVVLPILQRYSARATFFIPSFYINERRLFWWDRITYLVGQSRRERLEITYPRPLQFDLVKARGEATRELLRIVKTEPQLDLPRFLAEVGRAADITIEPEREREWVDLLLMTWKEIAALDRAGMNIESHTVTHRVLGTLAPDALRAELVDSRHDIREHTSRDVTALAYPVGYRVADSPGILAAITEAGYRLGFTNQTGVNVTAGKRFNPLDVHRHAMESGMADELFRALMAFPYLARTR